MKSFELPFNKKLTAGSSILLSNGTNSLFDDKYKRSQKYSIINRVKLIADDYFFEEEEELDDYNSQDMREATLSVVEGIYKDIFTYVSRNYLSTLSKNDITRYISEVSKHYGSVWGHLLKDANIRRMGKSKYGHTIRFFREAIDNIFDAAVYSTVDNMSKIHWVINKRCHGCMSCSYLERHSPYIKQNLPSVPKAAINKCRSDCDCFLYIEPCSIDEWTEMSKVTRSTLMGSMPMGVTSSCATFNEAINYSGFVL